MWVSESGASEDLEVQHLAKVHVARASFHSLMSKVLLQDQPVTHR